MERLYVITRNDLPMPEKAVQAGHGVGQFLKDNPGHHWQNSYLEYLVIEDGDHLEMLCIKLRSKGYTFSEFIEPDMKDQRTCIALYGDGKPVKHLDRMGAI